MVGDLGVDSILPKILTVLRLNDAFAYKSLALKEKSAKLGDIRVAQK